MEARVQDDDLEDDEDADRNEAEETNLGENLLEVTGRVVVGADERRGATEKRVGARRDNDALGLALLADRRREALVADLLALRERLARETGLVDRDVDGVEEAAVGRDDVANLERNHVAGNEVGRVDLEPRAVAAALGLGRERLHEGLDGVAGRVLLVEADRRVDEEEEDDADKVLPVGRAALAVGQGDGDERGALHDPRERVPHEPAGAKSGIVRNGSCEGEDESEEKKRDARKELEELRGLLVLELVGAEDATAAVGLGVGETLLLAPARRGEAGSVRCCCYRARAREAAVRPRMSSEKCGGGVRQGVRGPCFAANGRRAHAQARPSAPTRRAVRSPCTREVLRRTRGRTRAGGRGGGRGGGGLKGRKSSDSLEESPHVLELDLLKVDLVLQA